MIGFAPLNTGSILNGKVAGAQRQALVQNYAQQHGNRAVQRMLGQIPLKGATVQRACASCQEEMEQKAPAKSEQDFKKPYHIGFSPEELDKPAEESESEEAPGKAPAPGSQAKTVGKEGANEPGLEAPHAGSATIVCKGGNYVVELNDWAGQPCGISNCVTAHEKSHIKDWKKRWPKGCKKDDGGNQDDGYLPLGGDGYDEFLKKSECTAHTVDLNCAETRLKTAKGDCKDKWKNYIKLTKEQKKEYC